MRVAGSPSPATGPAGHYETAFRVIGRYMDDQKPRDVFFFEQDGAFVMRLLMSGQAGSRHQLAEFTQTISTTWSRAARVSGTPRRSPGTSPSEEVIRSPANLSRTWRSTMKALNIVADALGVTLATLVVIPLVVLAGPFVWLKVTEENDEETLELEQEGAWIGTEPQRPDQDAAGTGGRRPFRAPTTTSVELVGLSEVAIRDRRWPSLVPGHHGLLGGGLIVVKGAIAILPLDRLHPPVPPHRDRACSSPSSCCGRAIRRPQGHMLWIARLGAHRVRGPTRTRWLVALQSISVGDLSAADRRYPAHDRPESSLWRPGGVQPPWSS